MPTLAEKIAKSKAVMLEAAEKFKPAEIAIAWKGGKDTTTMMHIMRDLYNGQIPYRVFFNDTTLEFEEVYHFIDYVSQLWNLNLMVERHSDSDLAKYHAADDEAKKELARLMKINSLNAALKKYHLQGFMLGIRWDEHPARAQETYFSARADHIRIHPLLHFTEADIWDYIHQFNVPYVKLYDQGYRSIGEKPFTVKASSGSERSGREPGKEEQMEKLRSLGYW